MHINGLGHVAQGERPQFGHAPAKEAILPPDDLARRLEDGLLPLVERADQPIGIGQLLAQPALLFAVVLPAADLRQIGTVDDQRGQRRLVERDMPTAILAARYQYVWRNGGRT